MKKRILIAGGSGLIGNALQKEASAGEWDITMLSRSSGVNRIKWDPENNSIELPSRMNFDAIINLAGESISEGRWTTARKKSIYNSRINSCRTLENYLFDGRLTTGVYIGASAVGIYGDRGTTEVNEKTTVKKTDWFTKTVIDWEIGHHQISALEIRTAVIRIGIVLSKDGGALKEILQTAPFGFISYFGSGKQIWPWIHIDDLAMLMFSVIDQQGSSGIFLGTSPQPVSNKNLIRTVNKYLPARKIIVPAPKLVLKLMLGEMHRVLFDSCNAIPQKLINSGFQFKFSNIDSAAKDLVGR